MLSKIFGIHDTGISFTDYLQDQKTNLLGFLVIVGIIAGSQAYGVYFNA